MIKPLQVLKVWPEAPGEKTMGVCANIGTENKEKNKTFRYLDFVFKREPCNLIIFYCLYITEIKTQKVCFSCLKIRHIFRIHYKGNNSGAKVLVKT